MESDPDEMTHKTILESLSRRGALAVGGFGMVTWETSPIRRAREGVLKTGCAERRSTFAGCPRVSLRHNYIANLSKVGPPVRFTGALLTDARS